MRNISRASWSSALLGAGMVLVGANASAQGDQAGSAESAEAKPAEQAPAAEEQSASAPRTLEGVPAKTPRDPAGIKGISPFWEAVRTGDVAYVAQDYGAAEASYRAAIKHEPNNPIGHLRLGEVLLHNNNFAEAEAAWQSALRDADKDPASKAKALFMLADLNERKKAYPEATERWQAYKTLANANTNTKVKMFPATAEDRLRRVGERQEMLKGYGAVRDRIEKEATEGDKQREKSAK
ncbi:MAG: tetratricopeptide repeat protein [Polyangiaceae bacterium]|nr:tetratricopeptide repeat protein [Polyangiaceae bacterium]